MITSKREMVYQEIKEHILVGKLKNNTRITERGLAEKLNVTRVPVRESLVQLEQDGLIRKIPSKGYIVDNYSAEEFEEAMMMRFVIECQAAIKAAQSATPEDIAELRNLNEALKNAGQAGNVDALIERDREFHLQIVKASRNKVLNKLYSIISIPVFHNKERIEVERAMVTFKGHERLIEAIENRDSEAAFVLAFQNTPGRKDFRNNFYNEVTQKVLLNTEELDRR